MKRLLLVVGVATMLMLATDAGAQQVNLVLQDGRVSLSAQNASIRQILAEWERLGQVKVVGADGLAGQPLTLTLENVSERQALDIVLRAVPGYVVVERASATPVASRFARVVILPRASAPEPARAALPTPTRQAAGVIPAEPTIAADKAEANDEVADAEGTQAPVAAPAANAFPGMPTGTNGAGQPVAGGGASMSSSGPINVQPEVQFDYANPQKYFEQLRQQQNQQQGMTTSQGSPIVPVPQGAPGTPTASPTAPQTLARPGIAPVPQQQQGPGRLFNPYNLPPDQLPPGTGTVPQGTTVEPDRSKYANPYVPQTPTKPPDQ
jgi:hypothetical protein